jgi:hypothetical protein
MSSSDLENNLEERVEFVALPSSPEVLLELCAFKLLDPLKIKLQYRNKTVDDLKIIIKLQL